MVQRDDGGQRRPAAVPSCRGLARRHDVMLVAEAIVMPAAARSAVSGTTVPRTRARDVCPPPFPAEQVQ